MSDASLGIWLETHTALVTWEQITFLPWVSDLSFGAAWGHAAWVLALKILVTVRSGAVQGGCVAQTCLVK